MQKVGARVDCGYRRRGVGAGLERTIRSATPRPGELTAKHIRYPEGDSDFSLGIKGPRASQLPAPVPDASGKARQGEVSVRVPFY
eukprot:8821888-Pyramimonas_sp.AAC.1